MKKGDRFECKISGIFATGRVQKRNGHFYLCQDVVNGSSFCADKYGYKYSWYIGQGTKEHLADNDVTNFRIIPTFQAGDVVEFLRKEDMHWVIEKWTRTSRDIGHRDKVIGVDAEGKVQLSNGEYYNPEGLKLVERKETEVKQIKTKGESEMNIRDDILSVFTKSADAKVVAQFMSDVDLGQEGFLTTLLLEQNKEPILKEAKRRKAEAEEKDK